MKVINRARKSEWTVHKLRVPQEFGSLEELKRQVSQSLNDVVENPINAIGYIELGHGMRGKQRWLTTNEDLTDMYGHFSGKSEVLLWCYSPQKAAVSATSNIRGEKRPRSEEQRNPSPDQHSAKAPRTTKYELHQKTMDELEIIYEELQDKHKELYTAEQLRAWAHLIQMKKHESYEEPPNKPFFKNARNAKSNVTTLGRSSQQTQKTSADTIPLSPSKHVTIQGQLIDQISKLHELLERGAISKEQYDKLQGKILCEIEQV